VGLKVDGISHPVSSKAIPFNSELSDILIHVAQSVQLINVAQSVQKGPERGGQIDRFFPRSNALYCQADPTGNDALKSMHRHSSRDEPAFR